MSDIKELDRVLSDGWQSFTVFANGHAQITRDFCQESSCCQGHISIEPVAGQPKTYKATARYYDDIEDLPDEIPEKVLLEGAETELDAIIAVLRQGHCLANVWVDMGPNEGRAYHMYQRPRTGGEWTPAAPGKIYDWAEGYQSLENA